MNKIIPPKHWEQYQTVFDGGCLEHVFNVAEAFANCSRLCRQGGQIIHALPANNFCGHGFWQFSPELFFSLYCEANGFANTEVLLANLADRKRWFRVKQPRPGARINVYSGAELYVLVRTVRVGGGLAEFNVQQSDYVHEWAEGSISGGTPPADELAATSMLRRIAKTTGGLELWPGVLGRAAIQVKQRLKTIRGRASSHHPDLVEVLLQ